MRTMKRKQFIILCTVALLIGCMIGAASCRAAEEGLIRVWILCKPGSQVIVRQVPSKTGTEVGALEVGDWFLTDGKSSNGFIRAYGIGEHGEGWVYCGYVATEEPVPVFENYSCIAKNRVACRRWMEGPQTSKPWLVNGSSVTVFHIAGEWACTSRGYIRAEWLEADPL